MCIFIFQIYFLYAPSVLSYFLRFPISGGFLEAEVLSLALKHHEAVCFTGYIGCLVAFVLSLDTQFIRR